MNGRLTIPLSVSELNRELGARIARIVGDDVVVCRQAADTVTISLNIDALNAKIARSSIRALITGTATPPGLYNASTFVRPSSRPPAGSSTMWTLSQLGQSLNNSIYVFNGMELGKSSSEPQQWDLNYALNQGIQLVVPAIFMDVADDGKPVYLTYVGNAENCGQ